MVDRVKPLKLESPGSGGTQVDEFPTSLNPNEDFLDARGLTLQNDTSDDENVRLTRDSSDRMVFLDGENSSPVSLSTLVAGTGGLTPTTHRELDQLVHEIDENFYSEYTYSGKQVTNITVWTDSGKTTKIRETQLTYSGKQVSQTVEIQYDGSGTEVERLTCNYTYSGKQLISVSCTRS